MVNGWRRLLKEAAVTYWNLSCRHSYGETEENHKCSYQS